MKKMVFIIFLNYFFLKYSARQMYIGSTERTALQPDIGDFYIRIAVINNSSGLYLQIIEYVRGHIVYVLQLVMYVVLFA